MLKKWIILLLMTLLVIPVMAQGDEEIDTTDWIVQTAGEIAFITPPDWVNLTEAEDIEATMDELAELNPDLAETFAAGSMALDQVDILVIDPTTGANLNVLTVEVGGLSLDDLEAELLSQYQQMGFEVVALERFETALGDTMRVDIQTTISTGSSEELVSQFQLITILESGDAAVITFTPGSASLEEIAPLFDVVIDSLSYADAMDMEMTDDSGMSDELGEFVTYTNDGLSISVPESWIDVSDEDALMAAGADALSESNPQLSSILEMAQTQDFAFFLLDPTTTANLNVIVQASPSPVTLDQLEMLLPGQYESFGITVVDSQRVELPAGEALRFQLEVALDSSADPLVVKQFQYILVENDNFYFLTMGLATDGFEDMTPIFEAIAESLELE
ncbi:MAG: hypothetical protein CUN56_10480 [Phototrophicales bacterium]|nr:MAG: hypothetical protein CUN56_10480 [Phototrophicales bacterium]RMG74504.1 MAG: hypothetical protein D6711_08675 [Chloroflexota bacterium]